MSEICQHDELYFGSGGYYVFCKGCTEKWVAITADHKFDPQGGTRAVYKSHEAGSFKWLSRNPPGEQ